MTDRSDAGVAGFDAVLPDGRPVAYRATTDHGELVADGLNADAGSLLVARHPDGRRAGVVLDARSFDGQPVAQPDFEFDMPGPGQPPHTTAILAPTGFRWSGPPDRVAPEYTSTPP